MALIDTQKLKNAFVGIAAAALAAATLAAPASAQTAVGESYEPTIWIDPDGCEHWVFDDGFEGYMDAHLDREGNPVCRRQEICGVIPTDTLFATDRSNLMPGGREALVNFFSSANAFGFLIYGHTDSRASDEYNIDLSNRRANTVAEVAQSIGARVVDVRGFGERRPRATNDSAAGMQQNRRVEVYCIR